MRWVESKVAARDALFSASVDAAAMHPVCADGFGRWYAYPLAIRQSVGLAAEARLAIVGAVAEREQKSGESIAEARSRIAPTIMVERSPRHDEPGRIAFREVWED